jgi:archaeal type IV pilus assembly protein PilA
MDLKKLFKNNDAVSPVIGVILMVAITVILAAAIGSSVFGQGTTNPAPKANINIKAIDAYSTSSPATVIFEHNGGDPIHFEDSAITKVVASINGENSIDLNATSLKVMSTGSAMNLDLKESNGDVLTNVTTGITVNFKVVDVKTNQLIISKDVRF